MHSDCRFQYGTRPCRWSLLHQFQWWIDSNKVDSSWGSQAQNVFHSQWCVELWLCDVWDLEPGTQTIWRVIWSRGRNSLHGFIFYSKAALIWNFTFQVVRRLESGYRLSPPPGCPYALYELMIKCWYETVCTAIAVILLIIPHISLEFIGIHSLDNVLHLTVLC